MRRVIDLLVVFALGIATVGVPAWAQGTSRPAITGIAFFQDYSTHPVEAETFYGKTLGLRELKSASGTMVFPVNRSQWVEVLAKTPPQPNDRMAAVGLTVRDVRAMEAYLKGKGVAIAEPLHESEFGVQDPEGHRVVFVESPYGTARGETELSGTPKMVSTMEPLPSATSHRMIHVGFVVHDRDKEDAFWRQLLGFRMYWHGWQNGPDAAGHKDDYVSLQVPDGTDWIEYMLGAGPEIGLRQAGVMNHFSLGTERMQTVLAQLQANGCEGKDCTAIQAGRDGKIQLNLYDPDYTRVEFMEFTNAMKPCCSGFEGTMPGEKESE